MPAPSGVTTLHLLCIFLCFEVRQQSWIFNLVLSGYPAFLSSNVFRIVDSNENLKKKIYELKPENINKQWTMVKKTTTKQGRRKSDESFPDIRSRHDGGVFQLSLSLTPPSFPILSPPSLLHPSPLHSSSSHQHHLYYLLSINKLSHQYITRI